MALVFSSQFMSCSLGRHVPAIAKYTIMAIKPVIKSFPGRTKASLVSQEEAVVRRSGNYKRCKWDYNFVRSLESDYKGEEINSRALEMKANVELMLKNMADPLDQMELINHLQRLGLGYCFDEEIKLALKKICNNDLTNEDKLQKNLHATALKFRLLREHGYHTTSEIFGAFTENERFKESLGEDVKGMLSLYEASYYSVEGESLMEEACSFTRKILKERVKNIDDSDLAMQVQRGLELPLQWRLTRFDAKWYIDIYERCSDMIPAVLQFAKLDYNILQGLYQEELVEPSRWWDASGLGDKPDAIRDRLVASFLWTVGVSCRPDPRYFRVHLTKAIQLSTTIDGVYDVYGTLDELEIFTSVIERWDINALKELPHYMQLVFLTLYNHVNEAAYDILREQKLDITPHLRKAWAGLTRSYLVEARWYHTGYKPTFEEYMKNGINELKRGDVPKAIQCYMMDTGVSEEVARKHMLDLMKKKWAKLMKLDVPLEWSVLQIILNLVRMSHCTYNAGDDGYGIQEGLTEDKIFSLFSEPVPLLQDTVINGKD